MKIAVLNTSGNVGKSTVSRELLYSRLDNPFLVEVESVNSSSSAFRLDSAKYYGDADFTIFYEFLVEDRDVIFDLGASEIVNFFTNSEDFDGAIDLFDYFLVVCKADSKIMEDTVKTINFLRSQEISDDKIKVIFNEVRRDVKSEFAPIFNFDFPFDENLFIKNSSVIKDCSLLKTTFFNAYNADKNYYRDLMKNAENAIEKKKFLKMDLINRAATKKIQEFDFLFSSAFNENFETDLSKSVSKAPKIAPTAPTKNEVEDEDL